MRVVQQGIETLDVDAGAPEEVVFAVRGDDAARAFDAAIH